MLIFNRLKTFIDTIKTAIFRTAFRYIHKTLIYKICECSQKLYFISVKRTEFY